MRINKITDSNKTKFLLLIFVLFFLLSIPFLILRPVKTEAASAEFSVEKKVRNLTEGEIDWQESTSAKPNDKVAFRIIVSSPSGGGAYDLILKDTLPGKIIWYGNLEINGVSSSGSIVDGLEIGDLAAGQSKTITFEMLIASEGSFPYGVTDLINVAMVYNIDRAVTDAAKVTVQKTAIAGATDVPTGVLDNAVLSLAITFLITYVFLLGHFFYQKTNLRLTSIFSNLKFALEDWFNSFNPLATSKSSERKLRSVISEIRKREVK